jgi:hypothetical protein
MCMCIQEDRPLSETSQPPADGGEGVHTKSPKNPAHPTTLYVRSCLLSTYVTAVGSNGEEHHKNRDHPIADRGSPSPS